MNKERRSEIAAAIKLVEAACTAAQEARDEIERIKGDEEAYKENMPESMQDGEKGQRADDAISAMDEAYNALDEIDFDGIVSNLETASE